VPSPEGGASEESRLVAGAHPDDRLLRHSGDGWVDCRCGSQHWGLHGAAGLLLTDGDPTAPSVILQHRALWSHHGGTWGIPGGALSPGESPADGAVREAVEEAGVPEGSVRAWGASTLVHPDWSYTTILGEALYPFTPAATDAESLEIAWVPVPEVEARPLLPAFAHAWPTLVSLLGRRPLLVVDAANVVGSRPDGWWRDRAGAARRLVGGLSAALPRGFPAELLALPADRWWPDVLAVLEGAARAADVGEDPPIAPSRPALEVVRAPGSGDDAIVEVVRQARDRGYTDVAVVTSDRELGHRVRAVTASVAAPRQLLAVLDSTG
jgi:8-oxo-dGTP diphosphatase